MNWYKTRNLKSVSLDQIPIISFAELQESINLQLANKARLIAFFGYKQSEAVRVFIGLANDEESIIMLSSVLFKENDEYESFTPKYPVFQNFERELYEEFNIKPLNHPWLKPFRFPKSDLSDMIKDYPFFSIDSAELHEVAVGPIHAGVIEPGHFRFICDGEKVLHLEIQLGYQHRGVEQLLLSDNLQKIKNKTHLAESIVGDTCVGNTLCYAQLIESLGGIETNPSIDIIRAVSLELERMAVHIGDLSAIANDVAYLSSSSYLGHFRTAIINLFMYLCGNRFARNLIKVGGVSNIWNEEEIAYIKNIVNDVLDNVSYISEIFFEHPSVLSRLEHTGILSEEIAEQIGIVGLAGRASGLKRDVRADHPFGFYKSSLIYPMNLSTGDVFARAYMRYIEIQQSARFILENIDRISQTNEAQISVEKLLPNQLCIAMVEAWRGELIHIGITDEQSSLVRYKIKDPSFNNWFGLAQVLRNNGISDFPLCNKSFNLSYCGNDL